MKTLRYILGDQLSRSIATLEDLDPATDVVLMTEVGSESRIVGYHKQKLVLIYSGMRHFAQALRQEGIEVDYVRLDDPANTQDLTSELARAVERHRPDRVVVTEPGAWRALQLVRGWEEAVGFPVDIREDTRFLCGHDRFASWAMSHSTLRMEYFYREMRGELGLLMSGNAPEGGQWNYDEDNRAALPRDHQPPERLRFEPDATTREVIELVRDTYPKNFGALEPFGWATTREDALRALDHFIADCLPLFGTFQDAMQADAPFLYHAVLSPYLNIGFLTAQEVVRAADRAFYQGDAPLNAVEGFIRQVVGWREYIRGIYWLKMPQYAQTNAFDAHRPLPWFYWSGQTSMNCMANAIRDTSQHAYAHHIHRLMVTGNFALLAGIEPAQLEAWYLAVYADAYDWVELPNVHGMVMYADGGLMASKPYVASGAYINRMSNYCGSCRFDPKVRSGPKACPFTLLYWNFLIQHREALRGNPRMRMPYRNLDRMDPLVLTRLQAEAGDFLAALSPTEDTGPAASLPETQMDLGL